MTTFDITRRGALLAGLGVTTAGCATVPGGGAGAAAFAHGVASGDPTPDGVVIWTRAAPASPDVLSIPLRWVVAEDPALETVVARGETAADVANDFCAKVDVAGLAPGRAYHYGFFAGRTASPVGRTRTLPVGRVERLRLAVFSCSNFPFGRFHAYADMAARSDVDFALHLGDYIYESGGERGWGWAESQANGRVHEPRREIVSLADYRARYAQYRSDPDLQAAHAATAWILTWDDHEIADNPWIHGARNHNPEEGEGSWEVRKRAALRAYFEWMPIREPAPGRAREAIWRRFDFGDLASLTMLETRLTGRHEQLDYERDLRWIETAYKADENGVMQVVPPDQLVPTPPPDVARVRTPFDVSGPEPRPIEDWDAAHDIVRRLIELEQRQPPEEAHAALGVEFRRDIAAFRAALEAPDRTMIDEAQEAWLVESVAEAEARGVRWQLIGDQVIFARQSLFDFSRYYDDAALAQLARRPGQAGRIERGRLGLPANLDAWDGYPVQRDRIADALSAAGAHAVFLAGDTHAFWANEVRDTRGARCAAEFGTTAVSSPGYTDFDGLSPPITEVFADGFPATRFADVTTRGYLVVTLTPDEVLCDMVGTARPTEPARRARVVRRWIQRRRDAAGVLPPLEEWLV